jgi:hypothetical protein
MNEGMHDVEGYRDELGGSQLHLDEVLDQLILFDGKGYHRLLDRSELSVQIGVVNHLLGTRL